MWSDHKSAFGINNPMMNEFIQKIEYKQFYSSFRLNCCVFFCLLITKEKKTQRKNSSPMVSNDVFFLFVPQSLCLGESFYLDFDYGFMTLFSMDLNWNYCANFPSHPISFWVLFSFHFEQLAHKPHRCTHNFFAFSFSLFIFMLRATFFPLHFSHFSILILTSNNSWTY